MKWRGEGIDDIGFIILHDYIRTCKRSRGDESTIKISFRVYTYEKVTIGEIDQSRNTNFFFFIHLARFPEIPGNSLNQNAFEHVEIK